MIADLQPGEVVVAEKIDRISRLPLTEAEQLVRRIRATGAKLAVPGLVDLSDLAAEADGVAKIVLESVQELLLKLALQMARDDYETRRERQRQGVQLAKATRIAKKRGDHNRLGFAVQLSTVRYLGIFLDDPMTVPGAVMHTLAKQLSFDPVDGTSAYSTGEQRWLHATEIRESYGYVEITEQRAAFRLTRWLYALCWTGTDRPSVLFERVITWLVMHKVLLPGCSTLERYIARLRSRVEERLWHSLANGGGREQQTRLENLLVVPTGTRSSQLDLLRAGPLTVSGPSLVKALLRLRSVRDLGIALPSVARIPAIRMAALARFAGAAKVSAVLRLPNQRRLATLGSLRVLPRSHCTGRRVGSSGSSAA
jgi:hypothetical protein